ncbi:MAG: beta-ketoacyl-[acyl-carrier-protein] synthase family protein [Desulfobacterales bacterium]|nr:MAG: beta-ketoacyl-[acyl-carrier-protein] synthase family protein [Desulfobacterales bacterium]
MRRVVITGLGAVSPLGSGAAQLLEALCQGRNGITRVPHLAGIGGLRSQVAGLVQAIDPQKIPRKYRRSMSPMSIYAILACQEALTQAELTPAHCASGQMGVAIGSTVGSPQATQGFFEDFLRSRSLDRMKSTLFFKIMNHSCAANIAQALEITGRVLAPSSACSTSCQAIGYGYEMIACGKQDFMLCGGADEFHPLTAATFDIMNAASFRFNERPQQTPRPFDRDRDGVVCAEGSGVLLLESLEAARKRQATILGEIIGFATLSDPTHIAHPDAAAIERCMRAALQDGGVAPEAIDYVNAHATATEQGDIAECEAIHRIFGENTPVSSFKGHLGHALAASGALELAAVVGMLNRTCLIPTLNLENVDPRCAQIRHVRQVANANLNTVIKNNFALGGVNSSLVLRRYEDD